MEVAKELDFRNDKNYKATQVNKEGYRVKQDKLYKSDFDLLLEEIDKS